MVSESHYSTLNIDVLSTMQVYFFLSILKNLSGKNSNTNYSSLLFLFFSRMFHVVQYVDATKSVAVAPQSWYSDGFTLWPNYK